MGKGKFYTPGELVWHFAKLPLMALVFAAIGYFIGQSIAKVEPVVETIEIIKPQSAEKCIEFPSYVQYPVGGDTLSDYNNAVWVVVHAEATESQAEVDTIEGIGKRRVYGYTVRTGTYGKTWMRADSIDTMKEVSCDKMSQVSKRVR